MRGKVDETSINESSSVSDPQIIQANPYERTDVVQQRVIDEKRTDEPPPPYVTVNQPSSDFKGRSENVVDNPSLNNANFQQIPSPQVLIHQRHPIDVLCPACRVTVHTRVETTSTVITILLAILLFFFCCCLAVIPFCVPICKKTIHYCPNCNRELGRVDEFQ